MNKQFLLIAILSVINFGYNGIIDEKIFALNFDNFWEVYYNETLCPPGFANYTATNRTICYIYNRTCPYPMPLPFDPSSNLTKSFNETRIQVTKNQRHDFYFWEEKRGRFGTLFDQEIKNATENMTGDFIATYNETFTYYATDSNATYNQLCAYDALDTDRINYCTLYDKICAHGNPDGNTTNCHCRRRGEISTHFCELKCDNWTETNSTTCNECEEIFHAYKDPTIRLWFNYHTREISVGLGSYLRLLPISESQAIVYCFTDADHSTHDITYRYNLSRPSDLKYKTATYNLEPVNDSIGHYWCQGFKFDLGPVSSPQIIAEGKLHRESFTMNVTVREDERTYPLTIHEKTEQELEDIINNKSLIQEIKFLRLYERQTGHNSTNVTLSYRLYLNATNNTMMDVLDQVTTIFNQSDAPNIKNFTLSPSYCLPDTTITNGITLTWGKTLLGSTTVPNELCLQNNTKPVTRTCQGEYLYGTYWSEVKGTCVNNSGELFGSPHTIQLHNLTYSHCEPNEKINQLNEMLQESKTPITIDAHFMAKIFENVTSSQTLQVTQVLETASKIMNMPRDVLQEAQTMLNSTDMILYSLDTIIAGYNLTDDYFSLTSGQIYTQISNISSNITGAAFYETKTGRRLQPLRNQTTPDYNDTTLKLCAYLTPKTIAHNRNAKLVITVFLTDSLFNPQKTTTGYTTSVYVTPNGVDTWVEEPVVMIRPFRKYRAVLMCNYWSYGRNQLWYNLKGSWEHEDKTPACTLGQMCPCPFVRMNPFGILVGDEDDVILSIVTATGCALSALGSLAVIVTAVVYKQWREKSGTKILLNFVLTNLAQNIFLGFAWMLIIGYLQYMRYVEVFYVVHNNFVIWASVVAWILPIVPVITVLQMNDAYYLQDNFCYLTNRPLFYGVYVPVSITLTVNIVIFMTIIVNITCYRAHSPDRLRDNISWLNLRLVILLFFLMGLYWVFGVSARLTQLVALDYFFCISASLQGLVIFLYFIVFNKMTRNFWLKQLRRAEMITTMQLWLQQRRKIGRVKLDKGRTKSVKMRIMKSLGEREKCK
nr:PREDICTED: G-protein coupled receptor 126-like isoform X2 [Tribolium castaneum]|eukprot:XP_015839557.1 PREDICTED: G-protein coupled receptor 126-like isoform X2 [Tribolium castaneum]